MHGAGHGLCGLASVCTSNDMLYLALGERCPRLSISDTVGLPVGPCAIADGCAGIRMKSRADPSTGRIAQAEVWYGAVVTCAVKSHGCAG